MHYAKSLLALSVGTMVFADGNVGQQILDVYAKMPLNAHVRAVNSDTIDIYMNPAYYAYTAHMLDKKIHLERACLANGGNVYTQTTNSFGDQVEVNGYDNDKLRKLPTDVKQQMLSDKEFKYDVLRGMFSDKRNGKYGQDIFWSEHEYNTVCKDINSSIVMFQTEGYKNHIKVTLSNVNAVSIKKQSKMVAPIEQVLSEYITETSGNKYLLKGGFFSPLYYKVPEIVQKHCEEGGGDIYLHSNIGCGPDRSFHTCKHESARPLNIDDSYIGCDLPGNSYTIVSKNGISGVMTKMDRLPIDASQNSTLMPTPQSNSDDYTNAAISAGKLPLGAQSENNIGNRKLVSTVYSDSGSVKLINVQEIGGNNTYRNYRVENFQASDITDNRFVYTNLKLPQSIQNAKGSLVQQCSQYGAGKVSIDGYTATCSRQAYGNQCSMNLIYMRNDQFAGREALNCK